MSWNVGYEAIYLGDHMIEGQWEVDADSAESAEDASLVPYLLVGVAEVVNNPYPVVEWLTASELRLLYGSQVLLQEILTMRASL